MEVVSFIEPPQVDVIGEIVKPRGLRQTMAPPEAHDLVLQLDAAYSGGSIDSPDEAGQSRDLSYVDIDTFPKNLQFTARRGSPWARCAQGLGSPNILHASTSTFGTGRRRCPRSRRARGITSRVSAQVLLARDSGQSSAASHCELTDRRIITPAARRPSRPRRAFALATGGHNLAPLSANRFSRGRMRGGKDLQLASRKIDHLIGRNRGPRVTTALATVTSQP